MSYSKEHWERLRERDAQQEADELAQREIAYWNEVRQEKAHRQTLKTTTENGNCIDKRK